MRSPVILTAALVMAVLPVAAEAVPRAGDPAPDFTLPTTSGRPLSLSSLKGKPVYLNFFASWCSPCNAEAPDIGRLFGKYRRRGLAVVGVDELESSSKAAGFLEQYHLGYPAVVDTDGRAGKAYGALGLPVHVFVDRAGNVALYRLGEMSPAEIEAAIKRIL